MDRNKIRKKYIPIKELQEGETLEVQPNELNFYLYYLYTQISTITVRNLGRYLRQLRLLGPNKPTVFRLLEPVEFVSVAPGLSVKIKVRYMAECQKYGECYTDYLTIGDSKDVIKVALRTTRRLAKLSYERFINFGVVDVGYSCKKTLTFLSMLEDPLDLRLEISDYAIACSDSFLTLRYGYPTAVKIFYRPCEKSILDTKLIIRNSKYTLEPVVLKGLCAYNQLYVLNYDGSRLNYVIDWGVISVGNKVNKKIVIANNSCRYVAIQLRILKDKQMEDRLSPRSSALKKASMFFSLSYYRLNLGPYDQSTVHVTYFYPATAEMERFIKRHTQGIADSEYPELICDDYELYMISAGKKPTLLHLKYLPLLPKVRLQPILLNFGETLLHQNKVQVLTVINDCIAPLPVIFYLEKGSLFYRIIPKSTLDTNQYVKIYTIFRPKRIGKFTEQGLLKLATHLAVPIKLYGYSIVSLSSMTSPNMTKRRLSTQSNSCENVVKMKKTSSVLYFAKTNTLHNQSGNNSFRQKYKFRNLTPNNEKLHSCSGHVSRSCRGPIIPTKPYALFRDQKYIAKALRKFKEEEYYIWHAHPRNKLEYEHVTTYLDDAYLLYIYTECTHIDFGTVFVDSRSVRYFRLRNNTKRHIMVCLEEPAGVFKISHRCQIVPSGQRAGFELLLLSYAGGNIEKYINYTINSHHSFKLKLTANVMEAHLYPSSKHVKIHLRDELLAFEECYKIRLLNPGNIPVEFTFQPYVTPGRRFRVEPIEGYVQPGCSTPIKIIFYPKGAPTGGFRGQEYVLYFDVVGGYQGSISCTGYVNEIKCQVKETEIQFGFVEVGRNIKNKITLKNNSKFATVFTIAVYPSILGYQLHFNDGLQKLMAYEKKYITLEFCSTVESEFRGDIVIRVRGNKGFRIPFQATARIPRLTIVYKEIDFGRIVNNTHSRILTICNLSEIDAVFKITSDVMGCQPSEIKILPERDFEDLVLRPRQLDQYRGTLYNDDFLSTDNIDEGCYTMKVPTGLQIRMKLLWSPKDLRDYDVVLPIKMRDNTQPYGIIRTLRCSVTSPAIILSSQYLHFKNKVLCYKDYPKLLTLIMGNRKEQEIKWQLQQNDTYPFSMRPKAGVMLPEQQNTIEVSFSPSQPGYYSAVLEITTDDVEMPTFQLKLTGRAIKPSISFSLTKLVFPAVPLNTASRLSFRIENDGYYNLELARHKLNCYVEGLHFELEFRYSSQVSILKPKVTVDAIFYSSVPLSINTYLIFVDDAGNVFYLPVSLTADNCALTVFDFVYMNKRHISIDQNGILSFDEGRTIPSRRNDRVLQSGRSAGRHGTCRLGTRNAIRVPSHTYCFSTANYIGQWLSYFLSDHSLTFPYDFTKDVLQQFLTFVGGPKLMTNQTEEKGYKATLNEYSYMLKTLKKYGCRLSHVQPYFFLSNKEYNQYVHDNQKEGRDVQRLSMEHHGTLLSSFQVQASKAWAVLFYQICRVTLLVRIRQKDLKNLLSSINFEWKNTFKHPSNIYSRYETYIFSFLNSLNDQLYPITALSTITLVNQILPLILSKYIGIEINGQLKQLNKDSKDADIKFNISVLIHILDEFGLKMFLNESIMLRMQHKYVLIYLIHLLELLPYYIPKKLLVFECSLLEYCLKSVDLANPSEKPIMYKIKMIGHYNYSVDEPTISVKPKENVPLKVKFVSRHSQPCRSRIFLISQDMGDKHKAYPQVFELESRLAGSAMNAVKAVTVSSLLYKSTDFEIEVENHLYSLNHSAYEYFYLNVTILYRDEDKRSLTPFCLIDNRITVRRAQFSKLHAKYTPIVMMQRSCLLHFQHPEKGYFVYEIVGVPIEPYPYYSVKLKHILKRGSTSHTINLPTINDKIPREPLKAKCRLSKKYQDKKFKIDILEKNVPVKTPSEIITSEEYYRVSFQKSKMTFELPIQLCLTEPYREYIFHVILKNHDLTDVRNVYVSVVSQPPPITIPLEIYTLPMVSKVISLPVISYPAIYKLYVAVGYYQYLTLYGDLDHDNRVVKSGPIQIQFIPYWICRVDIRVIIEDVQTLSYIIYQITASCLEPPPESTIELTMSSQTSVYHPLSYPPGSHGSTLNLYMPYCRLAAGMNKVVPKDTTNFKLATHLLFEPLEVGTFRGRLRFVSERTGRWVWIAIKILVTEVVPTDTFYMRTVAGGSCQMSIKNVPRGSYEVSLPEYIYARGKIYDCPGPLNEYTLTYQPKKEGDRQGRLIFTEISTRRQLIYMLNLEATGVPYTIVPVVTCEVGKYKYFLIPVSNTLPREVTYRISNNNPQSFILTNDIIHLLNNTTEMLAVKFSPVSFKSYETALLILTSEEVLTQKFVLAGVGTLPNTVYKISVEGYIHHANDHIVTFRNPFREAVDYKIMFYTVNSEFSCVEAGKIIQLAAGYELGLTIGFHPKYPRKYSAQLFVYHPSKFRWYHLIYGSVCLQLPYPKHGLIKTCCRDSTTQLIEIPKGYFGIMEKVSKKNLSIPTKWRKILECSQVYQYPEKICLYFIHQPLKPHAQTKVIIYVNIQQGVKYQLPLRIYAVEPVVDDRIVLYALPASTSNITFRLTNNTREVREFQAYFTDDSHIEFTVKPVGGRLAPFGSDGTPFRVYFKPLEVRNAYNGKLVIETEDMYWSFDVVGRLPKYVPPTSKKTK